MSAVELVKSNPVPAPAPVMQSESAALISMLERAARDPSVDIAKMERLYQMHEAAVARSAKVEFTAALAALQADLPEIERKGTGHNDKAYARFEDFISAVRPHMARHGFSLTYRLKTEDKIIRVIGVLGHRLGHQEDTELPLPLDTSGNKNIVQAHGSTISYGKRYVGMTLLGMATKDDDDGKAAGAPACITEEQAADLRDGIESVGGDMGRFLAYFRVKSLSELPASQYQRAVAALKKKEGGK